MKQIKYFIIFIFTSLFLSLTGCTEDYRTSNSPQYRLGFSEDTVSFDTVFTTIGTPTNILTIYNRNNYGLLFDAYLAGGDESPFRINMDGNSGSSFSSIEIRDDDSLYCFISANLKLQNSPSPEPVRDSIIFMLESGIQQQVILMSYGQDVIIIRGKTINSDTTLTPDLPFYIYDSLVVSEGSELTVMPGCQLFFHKNAGLTVNGRITAKGSIDSIITFRGGRTDRLFDDLPYDQLSDQWLGIHIKSSSFENVFEYCDIRNGNFGIKTDSSSIEKLKLSIHSSKVQNTTGHSLSFTNCYTETANSLIVNSGGNCINIIGGKHNFTFCTIANFYLWGSRGPAIYLSNSTDSYEYPLEKATFSNCIVTGTSTTEFTTSLLDSINGDTLGVAEYSVNNSLVMTPDTTDTHFNKTVFDHIDKEIHGASHFRHIADGDYKYDFRLDSLSDARGIADPSITTLFPMDIAGNARPTDTAPDAGCYQYKQ